MRRRARGRAQAPACRDDGEDLARICLLLERLQTAFAQIGNPRAESIGALRQRFATDPAAAWREIDSNAWWAGAGSLAADCMADNPGLTATQWQAEIRALRDLLIEIGTLLRDRGETNPGLESWLLAFQTWNDSGI